jgi:ABC-2 type transport system ATP-binding protein
MKSVNSARLRISVLICVALTGCSGSSSKEVGAAAAVNPVTTGRCATPMARQAFNVSLTDNVPSDFDATATPLPTATTTINFTIMLPERCTGDRFPLILQSHGYSGSREKSIGSSGGFDPTQAHFPSINTVVDALPYHGYVVISYDERGHGVTAPGKAAHNARAIDPAAETQDAIAILDWAYYHSNETADPNDTTRSVTDPATPYPSSRATYVPSFVIREDATTQIARDIRVGTIGYSYGGGFEMPLALLDSRIDTMVPNGTWNNLLYSLLPGDAVKLGFDSLLCLLAEPDPTNKVGGNVNNTPLMATLCNLIGPQGPAAVTLRTRDDLARAATTAGNPRNARDADELLNFFYTHGSRYFEMPTRDGKPINPLDKPGYISPALSAITGIPASAGMTFPNPAASRRAIPVLFLQGNRDTLFNLTDSYFNYKYFKAAGGDVRLLTTEGGHMNPLALQKEGTANCGGVVGVNSILAWFDQKLKGISSVTYDAIPQVCISVTPTPAPNAAPTNNALTGVLLSDIPVGSLTGTGAIPIFAATIPTTTVTSPMSPVFVPIGSPIAVANAVLAGIPRIESIKVDTVTGVPPPSGTTIPVAYIGVGIKRGSTTILVDDEVTPFAMLAPDTGTTTNACPASLSLPATAHCNNRGTGNSAVLLPGVGELLQNGDQLGLLLYENHVQYLPANNAGTAAQTGSQNPHRVSMTKVELPVLIPGIYPGSSLSLPKP